tara:strand:+ start:607 stop:930 length:324 start_codon:yes stop_codon:yes gene_type:complete
MICSIFGGKGTMNKREERTLVHQRCVERIKRLRAMRGISQAQAAFQLGWKSASYSDIESYNKQLTLDKLAELAEFYGVTIGFLVDGHRENLSEAMQKKLQSSIEWTL